MRRKLRTWAKVHSNRPGYLDKLKGLPTTRYHHWYLPAEFHHGEFPCSTYLYVAGQRDESRPRLSEPPRLIYPKSPCGSSIRRIDVALSLMAHGMEIYPKMATWYFPRSMYSLRPWGSPIVEFCVHIYMRLWHGNIIKKWLPEPPWLMYSYISLRKFHKENYGVHLHWWPMTQRFIKSTLTEPPQVDVFRYVPAEVPSRKISSVFSITYGPLPGDLPRKWLSESPRLMYSYTALWRFHKEN